MSKRHVAFARPEEPAFLKRLKLEAGYQEGPTVNTKREESGPPSSEELRDAEDERPTVVVLREGDLSAEEAAREEERLLREKEEAPADLSARIIFKPRSGASKPKPVEKKESFKPKPGEEKKSKTKKIKPLLSFNHEEEEEDN